EKPCVFIDTPMKVGNPDWESLGLMPTDISLRNEVGVSVAVSELDRLPEIIDDMIENPERWREQIREARDKTVFNLGHGGEVAGRYSLGCLLAQQEAKELTSDETR
ncbi:MAG: hypothetical protein ACRC75_12325, partial [Olsenella sp.]